MKERVTFLRQLGVRFKRIQLELSADRVTLEEVYEWLRPRL